MNAIATWLETPIFCMSRRREPSGLGPVIAVASNPGEGNGRTNGGADQIGFFRVAGLIRAMLAILVPALVVQSFVFNLMIENQVRKAVDEMMAQVVTQKEIAQRQQLGDRKHQDMDAATLELRERVTALEIRMRTIELESARAKAR
jgi:hypothetical protein